MTDPLNIIIIGAGSSARRHAQSARLVSEVALLGFCDLVESRAHALAGEFGAQAFTDVDAALAAAPGGLAVICTPPGNHGALALRALGAGLHVLVEKPFELDLSFIPRVERFADAHGLRAAAVAQHRFSDGATAMRRLVAEGALGRITQINVCVQRHRAPEYFAGAHSSWRQDPAQAGGGVLISVGFHYLDVACWILGAPRDAIMTTFRQRGGVEMEAVGRFMLGNAPGRVEARWGDWTTRPDTLEIIGDRGTLTLAGDHLTGSSGLAPQITATEKHAMHARQLRELAHAIAAGRRPAVTATDVEPGLRLIADLYQSARSVHEEAG